MQLHHVMTGTKYFTVTFSSSCAEEVNMEQPPGHVSEGQEHLVCYLQRSITT